MNNDVKNYLGEEDNNDYALDNNSENNYSFGTDDKKLSELDSLPDDIDKSIITYFPFEDPTLTEKESMIYSNNASDTSYYEEQSHEPVSYNFESDINNNLNSFESSQEDSNNNESYETNTFDDALNIFGDFSADLNSDSNNEEINNVNTDIDFNQELSNIFGEENNYFDNSVVPNDDNSYLNNDIVYNEDIEIKSDINTDEYASDENKIIFPDKSFATSQDDYEPVSFKNDNNYENDNSDENSYNNESSNSSEVHNIEEDKLEDTAKFIISTDKPKKKEIKFKLSKKNIIILSSVLVAIILIIIVVKVISGENKVVTCIYEAEDTGYKISDKYIITFEKGDITYIEGAYKYEAKTEEFYEQISAVKQKKLPVIVNSNGLSGFTYNFENTNTTINVYSYIDYTKIDFKRLKNINQDVAPVAYFKIDKKDNKENLEENFKKEGYICTTK